MGGCVAPFCNNSTAKGYIMKIFPRDPVRRALWAQNVPLENWVPTNNSVLCEVHFAPEMWEANRKHKLKRDAIPTIFGFFFKKQVLTKDVENDGSSENNINEITSIIPSNKCANEEATDDDKNTEVNIETVIINDTSEPITLSANISSITESIETIKEENDKYKELVKKQQLQLIIMRKKLKIMRLTNSALKSKINNDKYKKAVSAMFNEDQIRALLKKNRTRNWSNETIQRALKIKFACGTAGYEEVLQNMPLPSLRTLRRKLVDVQFEPGISNQMFEFLKYKKSFFKEKRDLECGLIFDEMGITPRKCYNPATGSLVGDITFPGEKDY